MSRRRWESLWMLLGCGCCQWLMDFSPRKRRWLIGAAAVLMPIGYVVGAVPTVEVMRRSGFAYHPLGAIFISTVYLPLIWLDEHSDFFRWFFLWERALIERICGP